jgi:hypothetical protein
VRSFFLLFWILVVDLNVVVADLVGERTNDVWVSHVPRADVKLKRLALELLAEHAAREGLE